MYQRKYIAKSKNVPSKYVKKYPPRKYPLAIKNYQSKYELGQASVPTNRTARGVQLYQTPLWPNSKLIHNQLYFDFQETLTGTAGVPASRVYTTNGLFDPDISGTGHQPVGFDQMMVAYNHYSVIRAKITVSFMNSGATPCRVGVYLNPSAVALTDPVQIMENGQVKWMDLDCKSSPGTGSRIGSVSIDCDNKKYFGKGKYTELMEASLSGDSANNPVEQAYFTVFSLNPFDTGTTSVEFSSVISYDTIYHEVRKFTSS